jgi:hypothetical protein
VFRNSGGTAVFAPKVAKPQTKAAASSASSLLRQRSTILAHRHGPVEQALLLQRAIGNQATLRLLAKRAGGQNDNEPGGDQEQKAHQERMTSREAPRRVAWGFSMVPLFPPDRANRLQTPSPLAKLPLPGIIQPKFAIGRVDDPLEHEADRVADQVMRMSDPAPCIAAAPPQLSRKCAGCEQEEKTLQTKRGEMPAFGGEAPAIVHEVVRTPGNRLDAPTRAFFEPRFGHSFASVRVHTDSQAARSARAVDAIAYVVGRHIVFDEGRFNATTPSGERLLAHELAHVVQQRDAGAEPSANEALPISNVHEAEADKLTQAALANIPLSAETTRRFALARQQGEAANTPNCVPAAGVTPSLTNCSAYAENAWWLPPAYVVNATCACRETPDSPTSNCVRRFLQDRMVATPGLIKATAAAALVASGGPLPSPPYGVDPIYHAFVQTTLTPRIYQDHVDAYKACCCPSGPAPYSSWVGVTTVPIPVCDIVGLTIRYFGSCHGTPGAW